MEQPEHRLTTLVANGVEEIDTKTQTEQCLMTTIM